MRNSIDLATWATRVTLTRSFKSGMFYGALEFRALMLSQADD